MNFSVWTFNEQLQLRPKKVFGCYRVVPFKDSIIGHEYKDNTISWEHIGEERGRTKRNKLLWCIRIKLPFTLMVIRSHQQQNI